jgi:uncharacterized coiled-coil DUF342 family protein
MTTHVLLEKSNELKELDRQILEIQQKREALIKEIKELREGLHQIMRSTSTRKPAVRKKKEN